MPVWKVAVDSDMISMWDHGSSFLTLLSLIGLGLIVTLPEEYPQEVPQIQLECSRGKYPQLEQLKSDLVSEV